MTGLGEVRVSVFEKKQKMTEDDADHLDYDTIVPTVEMTESDSDALGCFGKYRATMVSASSAFPFACIFNLRTS